MFLASAFLIWRIVDFLVAFFAPRFIPYLGFFPYKESLTLFGLPQFIYSFASFDGVHYLSIAQNGYAQFQQAFFPLYPLVIKIFSYLFGNNYLVAGLVISNVSFLAALFVLKKYLDGLKPRLNSTSALLFLLIFPTSFYFGAVYSEGLFLLLLSLSLYLTQKKNYFWASITGFLAATTRLMGVLIFIPFLLTALKNREKDFYGNLKYIGLVLSPILGLSAYCLYLWQTVGDPFFFLTSQPAFGANRSTSLIFLPQVYYRYIKIFLSAVPNFQYFVSALEISLFTLMFVLVILELYKSSQTRHSERLGLAIFSLLYLILPTATGTFSSIPRYALLALSAFIFLSQIKKAYIKIGISLIFLITHFILLGFFVQGYFIG